MFAELPEAVPVPPTTELAWPLVPYQRPSPVSTSRELMVVPWQAVQSPALETICQVFEVLGRLAYAKYGLFSSMKYPPCSVYWEPPRGTEPKLFLLKYC